MMLSPLFVLLLALCSPSSSVVGAHSLLRKTNDAPLTTTSTSTLQRPHNSTGCARLGQLPEECHCHEPGHHQLKIECLKQFSSLLFNDTIGLMMDCDTTGIEPDLALVKFKKLVGGGSMQIVNQTVPAALRRLGYTEETIEAIVDHISKFIFNFFSKNFIG